MEEFLVVCEFWMHYRPDGSECWHYSLVDQRTGKEVLGGGFSSEAMADEYIGRVAAKAGLNYKREVSGE